MSHCMPETNELSSISPSAHHPALFLIQLGISESCANAFGKNEIESGDYAEDVAAQMLASSLGIPFDIDKSWDEKRQQWNISGQIYKTKNITQAAKGNKDGKWTTVFAAAVLIL